MNNQEFMKDSGLLCTILLSQYYQLSASPENLYHKYNKDGLFNDISIFKSLKSIGLKSKIIKQKCMEDIKDLPMPIIVKNKQNDYLIILKIENDQALVQNPYRKQPGQVPFNDLLNGITNEIIITRKQTKIISEEFKFGVQWFIPALMKHKRIFSEIILASFFIQLLALASPIFFQVTIDKVLVHNSLTTLDMLIIGMIAVSVFEVILSGLRTYVLGHTTNRVDAVLGSSLYDHLMHLPISFFNNQKVGQISTRVRELDTIRNFLTSSALTLCVDLFFAILFIIVMWAYSPTLTFVVLGALPFFFLSALILTPIIRKKLDEKFKKGAVNQAFLVESISGVETVKSLSLEPSMQETWDNQLSEYIRTSFDVDQLSNWYNQFTQLINKIMMALILWFGAQLVLSGDLTIGMLIAFNMLAGRLSAPIIKIAQLWNEFQQANISINRLADILNIPQEKGHEDSRMSVSTLLGNIEVSNVSFTYPGSNKVILKDVNMKIKQNQIIGLVGRSGSGKSTITKLIQRLYIPNEGNIKIDGIDISSINPTLLRKQVGVVLQDNFLFNKTIKENIAIMDPSISIDSIIEASKLAGAHDFIAELTDGYDTIIEEQGSNLSGGQKQRIAIARALVNNPKILIFDEATSALDYESEYIIQKNMSKICENKTVIIIAHRLSAIKDANQIFVFDKGEILEHGNHDDLIKKNGLFNKLNKIQKGELDEDA